MTTQPEENLSLVAILDRLGNGEATQEVHDQLFLELARRSQQLGASWRVIGKATGMSAKEAKAAVKKLEREAGRARRMQDNRGEEDET